MRGHASPQRPFKAKEGIMSKLTTKRIRMAVVALVAMLALSAAAVAMADVFAQKTSLSANAGRVNKHAVMIAGKLSASSHKQFCTAGRPIEVTNLKTGKTKTTKTNDKGKYEVNFGLGKGKHASFSAHYDGRRQINHPHRHICGASNAKTSI
jgi:type II secretory pathway pseudopilin PulG